MAKWKSLLTEIEGIEKKYGHSLRGPVSDQEIVKFKQGVQDKFNNVQLSESYIEFLKICNGLDFNGLIIYGVDVNVLEKGKEEDTNGWMETNELWYENDWQKQFIFYGDSDTAWYGFDINKGLYVELDKPSGTLIQSFDSFDSMLDEALQNTL